MKMMRENRGLTLVELVITIAIVAIVIAAATSFMITGSRSFTKGSADSDLQKEAELTVNQVEDMIIDVNGGLDRTYSVDEDENIIRTELVMYHSAQVEDESGITETKYVKESVVWKKFDDSNEPDEKMYYSKWEDLTYDKSEGKFTGGTQKTDEQLLAENVSLFEVDLDTEDKINSDGTVYQTIVRSVQIRVGYENTTGGVEYATSPIITLRNRILLSDDPDEIFEELPTSLKDMKLWYEGIGVAPEITEPIKDNNSSEVERGNNYTISARRITGGTQVGNELLNWSLETDTQKSWINMSTGELTVGANEPNNYLTIIAEYKSDPGIKAIGTVKVVGDTNGAKTFKAVHITTEKMSVVFQPNYGSACEYEGFTEAEKRMTTYEWSVDAPGRVAPFESHGDKLSLTVNRAPENYGRVLEISLKATSPVTGEVRTDKILYIIPQESDLSDSDNERGKLEHNDIEHRFEDKAGAEEWSYKIEFLVYKDGEFYTTSAYDHLKDYIILTLRPGKQISYSLAFTDQLPMDQGYYIRITFYSHKPAHPDWGPNGAEDSWTTERIHYIPPVRIYGDMCYSKAPLRSRAKFHYKIDGYYENAWAGYMGNPAFEYEIRDFDYYVEGDEYVNVKARVVQTETEGDSSTIHAEIAFDCDNWALVDSGKVKWRSMTIRVYAKNYPSIYTDVILVYDLDAEEYDCQK